MAVTVPSAVDSTSVAAMIKKLYPQRRIAAALSDRNYPFLSLVKKSDRFEGSTLTVPVEYDHPHISNTFSKALADYYPTTSGAFALTRVAKYGLARIDAETMHSTRSNVGGFVRVLDREISNLLASMKKQFAYECFNHSNGDLMQLSNVSTNVMTASLKSSVARLSIGSTLLFDNHVTGASPLSVTAPEVNAIDVDAGTFTVDDGSNATSSAYIFIDGNENGNSATGMREWIPDAAPTDTLFGVARSGTPLGGARVTDTGLSISESIQDCAYRIMTLSGASPDHAFLHPLAFRTLVYELESQGIRNPGGKAKSGFRSVTIDAGAGQIEVMSDVSVQENRCYVVRMQDWEILHLGGFPHIVMDDGLRTMRVASADQIEVRTRAWWQLSCSRPQAQGVCLLNSQS